MSTQSPTIQQLQRSSDRDDISIISDGYDYLVPATPQDIDISFRPERTIRQPIKQLFNNTDKVGFMICFSKKFFAGKHPCEFVVGRNKVRCK